MTETRLPQAVEGFAAAALGIADAEMDRESPWQGLDTDVRWQVFLTYQDLRTLAAEILAERSAHGPMITLAQAALAPYQVAYRDLQGLLLGIGDDELDRAPAEGEWPLRQVFQHVLNGDRGFLAITGYAVERVRAGDDRPVMMPAEERERLRQQNPSKDETLKEIFARSDALHAQVLNTLVPLGEAELRAPVGFWFEAEVGFHLYRFDAHLREHTIQIEKLLGAIRPRPTDAQRTMRLIYQALGAAEGAALGAPEVLALRREAIAAGIAARASALVPVS
jgi:hypothetical protein